MNSFNDMIETRAFNGEIVVYGTSPARGVETTAVRGAGKWTFSLLKTAETLSRGGSVWMRLPVNCPTEVVKGALASIRLKPVEAVWKGYEKKSYPGQSGEKELNFFGEYSFAETVGLWLQSGREPAAALLSPFISTEGFSFSPAEFIDLRERLHLAIRRYERLPGVSRGLEDLNTGFFRHRSLEESRDFITTHLAEYLVAGDELHRDFLLALNQHARSAAVSRRAEIQDATEALSALKESLEAAKSLSGRRRRKSLQQLAKNVKDYHAKHSASTVEGPSEEVKAITEAIVREGRQLGKTRQNLSRELQSAGLALSSLTVDPRHGDAETFRALENRLKDLVSAVDEAGLYQLPVGGTDAATAPRQLQQLESLLDQLRNTRHHLAELPLFYERRHFWYAQPAHLRRLLAPLLDLPTSEWEHAFSSWYFERCLERKEHPGGNHTEVASLARLFTAWEDIDLAGGFAPPAFGERLHFLSAANEWPAGTKPGDLQVSLTGMDDLPARGNCHQLRLAPLQDENSRHIAVAGRRDFTLLFTQPFLPLSPPRWRASYADTAPVAVLKDRILLQSDGAEWLPFTDWNGKPGTTLNCYLPAEISAVDAEFLLQHWEHLITAAPEIIFFHAWSSDDMTRALLSDGFNVEFLCAALLRAAEAAAAEPFDREALVALGLEVRLRCGLPVPTPHALAEEFGRLLRDRLPSHFYENHLPWRDTFLPLVVTAPDGKKAVLLPDGRLPGYADELSEARRQGELTKAGFALIGLPANRIWAAADEVLEEIAVTLVG